MVWMWMALVFAQAVDTGVDPAEGSYGETCPSCYEDGLCTARRGVCVAEEDDCRQAHVCSSDARCTAKDGVCVHGEGDCRHTWGCEEHGTCADQGDTCVASSAADCRSSDACARAGACELVGDTCAAASAADCAQSAICSEMGLCGLREGQCAATDDSHCSASDSCQRGGDCVLRDGLCATTPESCAASEQCRKAGECTSKGFACVVGSEQDCQQSEACTVEGECTFDGRACVPKTDAACKASQKCKEEGACWFLKSTHPEPDPAAGVLAQLMGSAGDGHGDMCGPKSDADCAQSAKCRDDGWCSMRVGTGSLGLGGIAGPTCTPDGYSPLFGSTGLGSLDSELLGSVGVGIGAEWADDIGGLGSRGSGMGGGGTAEGIGGLGTIGLGSGGGAGYGATADPEPRVDPVRVKGDRKPRAVRQALRAVRSDVKRCTEDELAVAFEVSGKGKLSAVEVRSGAEGKVAMCVAKAVGKADLGAGAEASVTWTVRAGAAKEE